MSLNKLLAKKTLLYGTVFLLFFPSLGFLAFGQEIKVKNTEPFVYVTITYKGAYTEVSQAINMLMYNARRQNILPTGPTFGIFPFSPLEEQKETPQWEVGFPVNPPINPQAPLQLKQWPVTKVAAITCPGTPSRKKEAYTALFNWLEENNIQQAGPLIERYLSLPDETSISPGNIEIWLPIKSKG
ncbi:GyrI-like domain-containing protein [Candidatus Aminicenantes bacterium AC-334-K16]|jgi:effector-binding domain-containing protein|nr:GyrI-like domain-containing protein [Candidatus Aminicenantes bacterium AC-334-K16]